MALRATLEADFGSDGFSLTGTVDGLGTDLDGIEIPEIDLDPSSVGDAAGLLDGLDSGAIGDAVGAVVDVLGEVGVEIPAVDELAGPLTAALALGRQLAEFDPAALSSLTAAGAEIDVDGIDGLTDRIEAVGGAIEGSPLGQVLDLLGVAVPGGLDLDGALETLGGSGAAIRQLVIALGGLMAVETAVADIEDGTALVAAMMAPSELTAVLARLRAAGDTRLADLFTGIDPDDPAMVELIAPLVRSWARDVRTAAEALGRGLGFGQATLVGLDLSGAGVRLDAAFAGLGEEAFDDLRAMCERLVAAARPLLDADLPDPADSLEEFWQLARTQMAVVAGAVEGLDPARLAGALTSGFDPALDVVRRVRDAVEQVVVTVRAAIDSVTSLIESVDLGALTDAITSVLDPVTEVIDTITGLIDGAQATIETASGTVVDAMDAVRSSMEAAASVVGAAFGRVQTALDALNLAALQATLEGGIQPIADALAAAQVRPFFDTAVDVVDTTADIVGAVPLGLLPDDAKQELAEAVEPVKQIDFQVDVADVLTDRMQEILAKLDTDVLGAIEDAYADVIEFLESVDPGTPLEAFEAEVFDPFLAELRAINPSELLAPLDEAIGPVKDALTGFDVGEELLAPIEEALDSVQAAVNEFQPSALIAPLQSEVDEVRDSVREVLRLDELGEWLDTAEEALTGWLEQLDPGRFADVFDRAFRQLVEQATAPLPGRNPLGSIVSSLLGAAGSGVRADAFDAVARWLAGEAAGLGLQQRLDDAAGRVEALRDAVSAAELEALIAQLTPVHRELRQAVDALPADSALREAIEPEILGASPLELLTPFTTALPSYNQALTELAGEIRRQAGSERQLVDAVAGGLREALRPLNAFTDWLRALVRRFGLDPAGRSIGEIVADLLNTLTPSEVLEPLVDALRDLLDRVGALATTGVLGPVRTAIADVEGALAAIDLGVIADELDGAHAALLAQVDAIRPSVLLGDLLTAVEDLQDEIAAFDPLGPVQEAVDAMTAAIEDGAEALRPTTLFAPAIDIYDQIVDALGALDVRALLDPLLLALEGLALQLDDGLDSLAVALKRLQDALPDAGDLAAGGGGGSVSVGLSVGGG